VIKELISTGIEYQPNKWYHVKIIFDGTQGNKGKYKFWISSQTAQSEEIYAGEYDYYAQYGRLIGVNCISLGVYDIDRVVPKNIYFDNFYFEVSP